MYKAMQNQSTNDHKTKTTDLDTNRFTRTDQTQTNAIIETTQYNARKNSRQQSRTRSTKERTTEHLLNGGCYRIVPPSTPPPATPADPVLVLPVPPPRS